MGIYAAEVRTSEHIGSLHRIVFGHLKVKEHASAEFAQGFNMKDLGFHLGHVPSSPFPNSICKSRSYRSGHSFRWLVHNSGDYIKSCCGQEKIDVLGTVFCGP